MPPPAFEPCPICGQRQLRQRRGHVAGGQDYTLLACLDCGLEHWQPLVAPSAEYYADESMALYTAMHDGTRRAEDDPRFARFLQEFASTTNRSLLDFGCSDGVLLAAFRALGNEVVGIDIDTRSLDVARRSGLEVYEATPERFAEEYSRGRRFDFVTMFDVLEHVIDPRKTLEIARSLLAPGGQLVGTVPNRERLFADLVYSDFPPHHFLRFDRDAIGSALRAVALVPQKIDVFEWGYAGPVLLNAAIKTGKRAAHSLTATSRRWEQTSASTERQQPRSSIKHTLASLLNRSLTFTSRPVERALGRGFKIYFSARVAS